MRGHDDEVARAEQLEVLGNPIGSNGPLIAAHALSPGQTLITDNTRSSPALAISKSKQAAALKPAGPNSGPQPFPRASEILN